MESSSISLKLSMTGRNCYKRDPINSSLSSLSTINMSFFIGWSTQESMYILEMVMTIKRINSDYHSISSKFTIQS